MARRYEFYVWGELVRYCSCHSNIKFISSSHRVISSIYLIKISNFRSSITPNLLKLLFEYWHSFITWLRKLQDVRINIVLLEQWRLKADKFTCSQPTSALSCYKTNSVNWVLSINCDIQLNLPLPLHLLSGRFSKIPKVSKSNLCNIL